MAAASKRAKKIVQADDFDLVRIAAEMRAPKLATGLHAWDLERIRRARDAQMAARFFEPARLAEAIRTDYALFAAFLNRLAPQRGLPVQLVEASATARAIRIRDEAEALFGKAGVGIHPDTLSDVDGTLANHGVAFGVNTVTPRADGSRVDIEMKTWPIEFVRWDPQMRAFRTIVEGLGEQTIVHGDGRWVVFQQDEYQPWKHGALLAAAMVWADHAFGVRDRAKASSAHGNAKVVGAMPQGISLQDAQGHLTPEAAAFLQLLRDIASADQPVGIKPYGAAIDYIVNNSQAWQIFNAIIDSGDKAADRIYLGTPVTAQAAGGDAVSYLFGVRNDIVEGSLNAIAGGIKTGVIDPWCALNFGDSSLAPIRIYLLPDADQDARRKSLGDRTKSFYDSIESAKKNGFDVSQVYVTALANDYGITAPALPAETNKAPTITLAPTDIAKVVLVNEARASAGLGPLLSPTGAQDPDGLLTVEEFSAKKAAAATAAAAAPVTASNPSANGATPSSAPKPASTVPAAPQPPPTIQ